jgi:hypothetical protein
MYVVNSGVGGKMDEFVDAEAGVGRFCEGGKDPALNRSAGLT